MIFFSFVVAVSDDVKNDHHARDNFNLKRIDLFIHSSEQFSLNNNKLFKSFVNIIVDTFWNKITQKKIRCRNIIITMPAIRYCYCLKLFSSRYEINTILIMFR